MNRGKMIALAAAAACLLGCSVPEGTLVLDCGQRGVAPGMRHAES